MRLSGYILLELGVGFALLGGVSTGGYLGAQKLAHLTHDVLGTRAQPLSYMASSLTPLAPTVPPRLVERKSAYFLGIKDDVLTAPLLNHPVSSVRFNRGGSSISLRLLFSDGTRAAFKPDQTNEQTIPRKEIAAFRLSRLVGLEAVAPAVPRRFTVEELTEKFDPSSVDILPRFQAEVVLDSDGMVVGELSWWIPTIVDAKLDGVLVDTPDGINLWRQYLTVGEAEPESDRVLLPQISNMLVFDYLINNSDRFSGSNTKMSPDGQILFFMDNTLSFGPVPEGVKFVRSMLEHSQKFSRSLVSRTRALDEARLREAMTTDTGPYEQLLTNSEIAAVLYRKDAFLGYVDDLIANHGQDAVLVYP